MFTPSINLVPPPTQSFTSPIRKFPLISTASLMALFATRRTLASTIYRVLSSSSSSSSPSSSRFRFSLPLFFNPQYYPSEQFVSTRPKSSGSGYSPLNDPSPNWSNRPPKETILLDGCDYEHWLIVMEFPDPKPSEEDMINAYVKTIAAVVGRYSEE